MFSYSKDFFFNKSSMSGGFSVKSITKDFDSETDLDTELQGGGGGAKKKTMTNEEKEEIDTLKDLVVPFGLVHLSSSSVVSSSVEEKTGDDKDFLDEKMHTILLQLVNRNESKKAKKQPQTKQTKKNQKHPLHSKKMSRRVSK